MEKFIQADDYELRMIIKNGPYIPMKTTEDGIRDRSPSRGLGDVYKRQTTAGGKTEWKTISKLRIMSCGCSL